MAPSHSSSEITPQIHSSHSHHQSTETETETETDSHHQQGILSLITTTTTTSSIGEHFEVQYARFFNTPSFTGTRHHHHPSLVLPVKKNKGSWIASFTSLATLRLLTSNNDYSIILQLILDDKIIEEHYISKLHFTWPKVSCLSGYPPRGSKVVFMSYRDQVGQIQKFAVRFLSVDEAERFINFLKDIFGHESINGSTSGISKSKISSQSEIVPYIQAEARSAQDWDPIASSEINFQDVYRPIIQDWSPIATPADTYFQPRKPNENYDAYQNSNPLESSLSQDVQGKLSAFPPSFTSLLMSCYTVDEQATQPTVPEEVTLKKEIMKYLEDSSFHEMLSKVQKVVNEFGDELLL